MTSQEFRITEVSDTAEKIISQRHPDSDTVAAKRKEVLEEWARLKKLASSRQGKFLIVADHTLIRGVLIQSCPAGAKNFTNYVFCHVQFSGGVIQNIENRCAIRAKF